MNLIFTVFMYKCGEPGHLDISSGVYKISGRLEQIVEIEYCLFIDNSSIFFNDWYTACTVWTVLPECGMTATYVITSWPSHEP